MKEAGLRRLLIFAIAMAASPPASATSGAGRAQIGVFDHDSGNYHGRTFQGGGAYNFSENLEMNFSAENLNRDYNGGSAVTDTSISAGSVWKRPRNFYLENSLSASTSADIFAKWSVYASPHVVSGNHDFGLAARYSEYKEVVAGTLSPSYFYSITDRTGLGLSAYFVRTGTVISSFQAQILIGVADRHSMRISGAAGRALEDAGLEADFKSVSAQYGFELTNSWKLGCNLIDYWSDIRNERSIGASLEYR